MGLVPSLSGVAVVVSAALLTSALTAQEPTYSVDVQVVNVFATVRDQSGRIVGNLSKEDFVLTYGGKPVEIRYFSRQTDLPLTIGLLADTSMSMFRMLDDEKKAAQGFFRQVLRPKTDLAFLIKFDVQTDAGSKVSRQAAIQAARQADTIVYCIRYFDEEMLRRFQSRTGRDGANRVRNNPALREIAERTGGRLFDAVDMSLKEIFQQIDDELRNQYSFGFTPADGRPSTRAIELKTKDSRLAVSSRSGL